MDVISVVEDERIAANAPHPFGGRVTIDTNEGTLERIVRDPPGEPSNFPTAAATREKFLQLSRPVLDHNAEKLADLILGLDAVVSVPEALAPARPVATHRDDQEAVPAS
jgi:2-methylcitrate dehydratase PrpD